jgi:hypothetical protein
MAGGGLPMRIEICAETGVTVAADAVITIATPSIQCNLIIFISLQRLKFATNSGEIRGGPLSKIYAGA